MSLSQKHAGKVLVPWFNISEWKSVYGLIYSETAPDWPQALQILKIWKHRTPLLSAGVEGSLIVLEALLIDANALSTYEVSQIFSTSLLRFLNLCAANSERQGTFYKAAMQNELPKWLVGIRHEIAHSHKVPSQSMLKLSLEFCLKWLKEKYWDVQVDNMTDFVVGEVDVTIIEDAVFVYGHLNENGGKKVRDKMRRCVRRFVENALSSESEEVVVESVRKAICEAVKVNQRQSCEKICSILVDEFEILSTKCEADASGNSKIPNKFLNKWNDLINIIYDNGFMPHLLNKLLECTCNDTHPTSHRSVASLWVKEIYAGLINKENDLQVDYGVKFHNLNFSLKDKNFVDRVLETPSIFTIDFLEEVLRYNNASQHFIEDALALMSVCNTQNGCRSDQIFTIDELGLEESMSEDCIIVDEPRKEKNSRWVPIEDTSPYMNLPLGILPHQDRSINPLYEKCDKYNFY